MSQPCGCINNPQLGRVSSQSQPALQDSSRLPINPNPDITIDGHLLTDSRLEKSLTRDGLQTLQKLRECLRPDELAPLMRGIENLQTYVGLLNTATAGDPAAVMAFGDAILSNLLPDQPMLLEKKTNLPSTGATHYLLAPHPTTFIFAGISLAKKYATGLESSNSPPPQHLQNLSFNDFNAPNENYQQIFTWIDRVFVGWVMAAGGLEIAFETGRNWVEGHNISEFHKILHSLYSHFGLIPILNLTSPSVIEWRVLTSAFVQKFLNYLIYEQDYSRIGSVIPADQCLATAGPITLLPPPGQKFPPPSSTNVWPYPAIDRIPAIVLSWTDQEIRLALPAGIKAGCHEVGWVGYVSPEEVPTDPIDWSAYLSSIRYVIDSHQGVFSLISAPTINYFIGDDRVEACTPARLSWSISLDACSVTAAQLVVTLWRNGQLFRVSLPTTGQLVVSNSIDCTYKLQVQARLDGQVCGIAEQSLTIHRFNQLHVQAYSICARLGVGITFNISSSCAASSGGLPITVTSDHPERVAHASGVITEGSDNVAIEIVPNECGMAILTFTAPNHNPSQYLVLVAGPPNVTRMTPTNFKTCEPVSFMLDGECLGEKEWHIEVIVFNDQLAVSGKVTVISAQTRLQVDLSALPVGTYTVVVNNCGNVAYTPTQLTVSNRQPVIDSFTTSQNSVEICNTPSISIQWKAHYATQVVITRNGTMIATRNYPNSCDPVSDSFTDKLSTITGAVNYVITAINADGANATSTRSLPPESQWPLASGFVVHNGLTVPVNVFLYIYVTNDFGVFLGTLAAGANLQIPIPNCQFGAIITLDPQSVSDYNAEYNQYYDPTSVITASTDGPWRRTTTAYYLGVSTANNILVNVL